MGEPKLTIDQLKNYLGTGLKVEHRHKGLKVVASFDGIRSSDEIIEFVGHDETFEGRCVLIKINHSSDAINLSETFPIFYRLSDLDKFIPELGFVPLKELYSFLLKDAGIPDYDADAILCRIDDGRMPILNAPFCVLQKLFQWHFWVFEQEYFEAGLVIDKLKHDET